MAEIVTESIPLNGQLQAPSYERLTKSYKTTSRRERRHGRQFAAAVSRCGRALQESENDGRKARGPAGNVGHSAEAQSQRKGAGGAQDENQRTHRSAGSRKERAEESPA